jgi:hypothetical protein
METVLKILRWWGRKPVLLWLLVVGCLWGSLSLDPYGPLGDIAAVVGIGFGFAVIILGSKDRKWTSWK